jgi:hypothetical protein
MEVVGREFNERVMHYNDTWLPARVVVQRALESRFQVNINHCYKVGRGEPGDL